MSEVLSNPTQAAQAGSSAALPRSVVPPHRLLESQNKKNASRKLSSSQIREIKYAELPQHERESAKRFAASSPYPEQWELNCIHEGNNSDNSHSGATLRGLPWTRESEERPWVHRDWLRSELKSVYPDAVFNSLNENGYWSYNDDLKNCIKAVANIRDNDFRPYREYNFHQCGNRKSHGSLLTYEGGEQRVTVHRCSETHCPTCTDLEARKVAGDAFDFIKAVAEAQQIGRMWTMVFTLPKEIEAELAKGTEARKQVLKKLQLLLRKVFGLKSRDTLTAYANIHAVGDSDPFRTRFHIHVGVLPIAISRNLRTGEKSVKHCDVTGLLDRELITDLWHEVLASVFDGVRRDKMNVRFSFLPLKEWTDRSGVKRPVKWGAVRHRLNYDMRGFGSDMLKAPIFHAPDAHLVAIRKGDTAYQVVSVLDVAKRWKWIRGQRDLRMWGAFRKRESYAPLLGVECIEEQEPPVKKEEEAVIRRRRGRVWDAERKQVVWVNAKKAFRLEAGKEIPIPPDVKYGQIGGSTWSVKGAG